MQTGTLWPIKSQVLLPKRFSNEKMPEVRAQTAMGVNLPTCSICRASLTRDLLLSNPLANVNRVNSGKATRISYACLLRRPHLQELSQGMLKAFKSRQVGVGVRCSAAKESTPVPVLDWYLFKAVLKPFLAAVAIFSTLGMSFGALVELIREVVITGLPLRVAFGAALLQAPRFLAMTLPLATLAGVVFGLSQLQANQEMVALYSAGILRWRLIAGPLVLGILAGVLMVTCNEFIVPSASARAQHVVETVLTTELHTMSTRKDVIHQEYGLKEEAHTSTPALPSRPRKRALKRVWYAKQLQQGQMEGLVMMELAPDGQVRRVVFGDECQWKWGDQAWELQDATVLEVTPSGGSGSVVQVESLEAPMPSVVRAASKASADFHDLTRSELQAYMKTLRGTSRQPPKVYLGAQTSLLQRDIAALVCIAHALVGASAALTFSKGRGNQTSVYLAALFFALAYSSVASVLGAAASTGAVEPRVAVLLPLTLALATGPVVLHLSRQ